MDNHIAWGTPHLAEQLKQLLKKYGLPEDQLPEIEQLLKLQSDLEEVNAYQKTFGQGGPSPDHPEGQHPLGEANDGVIDPFAEDEPTPKTDKLYASAAPEEVNGPNPVDPEQSYAPGAEDDVPPEDAREPELIDPMPVLAAQECQIAALGPRPEDYMVRDLMLGSLMRDERPRLFQRLSKKPPPWVQEMVSHLPERDQKQAAQFLALHLLHREHLARLLGEVHHHLDPWYGPLQRGDRFR